MKYAKAEIFAGILLVIGFIFSPIFCQGQKTQPSDVASAIQGRIDKNTYINDFFGFRLPIPDEGVVLNRAQMEVFESAGADILKSDNQRNNKKIESEVGRSITLLNYLTKSLGSADNASFGIGAIKQRPGATANLVLAATLTELTASGKYELVELIKGIRVGGVGFVGLIGKLNINGQVINAKTLVTMRKGYSIVISFNFLDDTGRQKVEAVLNSIQFSQK